MDDRSRRMPAPRRRIALLPLTVVAAAAAVALIVGWSSYEARTQREELRALMQAEGDALAEALAHAVINAIDSGREIEEIGAARLLDVAHLLERLDAAGLLSEQALGDLAGALDLLRIGVYDERLGEKLSSGPSHAHAAEDPYGSFLAPLVRGSADEVVLAPREGPQGGSEVFAAAVRRGRGGAILVLMDARSMLAFQERVGAGPLLTAVGGTGGILYAVLEDAVGKILAGAAQGRGGAEEPVLEFIHPIEITYGRPGRLRIGLSTEALRAAERAGRRRTIVAAVISVALAGAVVGIAAGRQRASTLRRRLEDEERRGGNLAAFGRLAASVAHEVRNPLNAIAVGVQRLEREFAPAERAEEHARVTALLRGEVGRLDAIVSRFLDLGRPSRVDPRPGDLAAAVRESVPLLDDGTPSGVRISADAAAPVAAVFDPAAVRQILHNLVRNAVEAVGGSGTVTVRARGERDFALIEVADSGPGIPAEDRERVFEFGFTRKPHGNGLGLAVVHRLATEMGGTVEIDDAPGRGALLRVSLPAGRPT